MSSKRRLGKFDRESKRRRIVNDSQVNLRVKDLPESVNQEALRKFIKSNVSRELHRSIMEVIVPIDKKTGKSKCTGYIHITDKESATKIILKLNGLKLEDRNMNISFSYFKMGETICHRDRMFDLIPEEQKLRIQFDEVSEYSVTPISLGDLMSKMIITLLSCNEPDLEKLEFTITDGTACVGGNSISFSKFFKEVHSVELDGERYKMLKNNICDVLQLENVKVYHGNFTEFVDQKSDFLSISQCVFLDPPWGGPDYKRHKVLSLYLGSVSIPEVCLRIHQNYPSVNMICLKLPNNFDFDGLILSKSSKNSDLYFPCILWSRFPTMSVVFLLRDSFISLDDFLNRAKKLPVSPEDCVFFRRWSFKEKNWRIFTPESYREHLALHDQ